MVITEMRTRHMPMEVLGFEIDGEHVGQQRGERDRDVGTVCAARIFAVPSRLDFAMRGHRWCSVGSTPRNLVPPSSPATLIVVKLCHACRASLVKALHDIVRGHWRSVYR